MNPGEFSGKGIPGREATVKGQLRLFPVGDLDVDDDSHSSVTWDSIMEDIARILVVSKYDRYLRDLELPGDSGKDSH